MKAWDKTKKHMLIRQEKGYYPKAVYNKLLGINEDNSKEENIVSPEDLKYIKSCRNRNSLYKKPLTEEQRVIFNRIYLRYKDFVRD